MSDGGSWPEAERFYADQLAALDSGDVLDIESLCAARPRLAADLRRLHADWMNVRGIMERLWGSAGGGPPRASDGGPGAPAALDGAGDGGAHTGSSEDSTEFTVEVLERLAERRGAFGRYEVKSEVARGGQGSVLRVWDEDLRRSLAMKVVLGDGRMLARFLEEAQVTAQLDHPGIVPVHELGIDSAGKPYFTMKLVKGRTLRDILDLVRDEREGWTRTRALGLILKVCEAMAYAHSKGVIHRDLKPANVMVGLFGEVYVMDWGLAKVRGRADHRDVRIRPPESTVIQSDRRGSEDVESPLVTMDGEVVGTPAYMPPEQAKGDLDAIGPHSDVYAVGAMLYTLLAGHPPYAPPDVRLNNYAVWAMVQSGPPAPVHERAPDVPAELEAICSKAMARSIEDRYGDMMELAEDLRSFLEGRVVHAFQTGAFEELRKWVLRNKSLAIAIAATVLVSILGLGTVAYLKAQEARAGHRVFRLSAFRELEQLQRQAQELWPAHPRNVDAYHQWLAEAADMVAGLEPNPSTGDPGHLQQLETLRARALPRAPDATEWRFADERDRWWHDQLTELVGAIEAFTDEETGLVAGVSSEYGWGIRRRLELARTIEERSVTGKEAARRWAEARSAVAVHPAYGGLDFEPQLGLVPLGPDPDSGLWEFWHVETGSEPLRDARGKLACTEDSGIVFVLLPGGTFRMGAQKEDPSAPNYDPDAEERESPVHEVRLSPFFMSKFEMTQGQWQRFNGSNPSGHSPRDHTPESSAAGLPFDLRHPVENVTWLECSRTMRRLGLTLPSEAQWEYAARGGTSSIWSCGDDPVLLAEVANLADAYAEAHVHNWRCEPWDDGFKFHAPVGTFRPNAFGLHDVHGNVWEWCLDGFDDDVYASAMRAVDPVVDPASSPRRVARGADHGDRAIFTRCAHRGDDRPDYRSPRVGLRPARVLEAR